MATLTVRLPAHAADRAARQAGWTRRPVGPAPRAAVLPRRATVVLSDLYALQTPAGAASLALETVVSPASPPATDDRSSGWFDSTWELQQGLDVAEGLPPDMPLEAWLQVYLAA